MKKFLILMVVAVVAFTGCAKKEKVPAVNQEAQKIIQAGVMFLKQNEPVKAVQSFAAAVKLAPDQVEGYYLLSETLVRFRQYTQARSVLLAAVQRFPDVGVLYYLLALTYDGEGNLPAAIVAAKKSLDLLNAAGDKEGVQRATLLLGGLISKAKDQQEAAAADTGESAEGMASGEALTEDVPGAVGSPEPTNPALQ